MSTISYFRNQNLQFPRKTTLAECHFPYVITLLLSVWVRRQPGVVPHRCTSIVINKVDPAGGSESHLPSRWQWAQIRVYAACCWGERRWIHGTSWIDQGGGSGSMIYKVGPTIWSTTFFPSMRQGNIAGVHLLSALLGGVVIPCRPGSVIDIVRCPLRIDSLLPALWQRIASVICKPSWSRHRSVKISHARA
jgi:hypothetical protein